MFFYQKSYINLLKLLITSISVRSNINKETTDILIITSPLFQPIIQKELESFGLIINYYILDLYSLFDAGCARLNIFKYDNINKYDKILYLDTDILINSDINILFNLPIDSDKIYTLEEGQIDNEYNFFGGQFFDFTKYDRNLSAFTSGILLFKNSNSVKDLFDVIVSHIKDYIYIKNNTIPLCLDQPFIVYNAISQNKYNNQLLIPYIENNPSVVSLDKIIYHFPGGPGAYDSKMSKMMVFWNHINKIIAVSPSDVYDTEKMKYLLYSSKMNNFNIEIIGLNKQFIFLSKILWFKEYLEKLPVAINPIICFTDAYDVFYVDSLDIIKYKFLSFGSDIVWSVERWYSHQLKIDKQFYDDLGKSDYKYINTGTFIGFKNSLLKLLNDIVLSIKDNGFLKELSDEGWEVDSDYVDQTIISHHLAKNWNKYNIRLDYECDIFYIPCGDWDDIDKYIDMELKNTITGKKPSVIHVCWKSKYEHILIKLFNYKYKYIENTIFKNRKYSWEDSSIIFLENGIMDAFGKGTYTQLDTYKFKAHMGNRNHLLLFNNDYTEFTSTRLDDYQIVKGKLL